MPLPSVHHFVTQSLYRGNVVSRVLDTDVPLYLAQGWSTTAPIAHAVGDALRVPDGYGADGLPLDYRVTRLPPPTPNPGPFWGHHDP